MKILFSFLVAAIFAISANAEYKYARATAEDRTPLDEYVARDDPTFSWTEIREERDEDLFSTLYYINMTSQSWLDESFSTQSVWWHYIVIAVPRFIEYNEHAAVFIGGGNTDNYNPPNPDEDALTLVVQTYAELTGGITVYLKHIPNQPIYFEDDPEYRRRTEDAMIAWTWKQFVDNPDFNTDGIARLPMTKAVIRTLDTVQEFTKQVRPDTNIDKFVLGGASKRGWTTWTATAVDTRIVAQVPMVLTSLNFVPNLRKHYRSLGGWSFALRNYFDEGLTNDLDNPRTQALMDIVDPYSYMSRYTMPTYVIAATGDQFFLPDDSWFFYDQLPGEKYFLMSANSDHSLVPWVDVFASFMFFYRAVASDYKMPVTTSTRTFTETGGRVEFTTDTTPVSVTVYYAITPDPSRRDFRANVGPDAVESDVFWIEDNAQDEAVYEDPSGEDVLVLSSEVQIIPDTYPFEACEGEGCYGQIV